MQLGKHTNKTNCITHPARVTAITQSFIEVSVISESACAGCHAKGLCSSSDQKEKIISIPNINQNVSIGEEVNVGLKHSLGVRAVLLAYVLPLFLLMVSILSLSSLNMAELMVGGLSIAVLAMYYFVLYLFKDKLQRVYNFHLVKV